MEDHTEDETSGAFSSNSEYVVFLHIAKSETIGSFALSLILPVQRCNPHPNDLENRTLYKL